MARCLPLVLASIAAAIVAPFARADLFVLNEGLGGDLSASGSALVFRFDAATGQRTGGFGYFNEGYYNMTVTSAGEVCVTTNVLGMYDIQRFSVAGEFMTYVASAWQGWFRGVLRGPGGHFYSIMRNDELNVLRIVKHDGPTPTVLVESGTGGMLQPTTMILGVDGNLYVHDTDLGILRFNATTGAFVGVFVPAGSGGMPGVDRMVFGPDGHLYVSARNPNIYRFNGTTGAFIDTFISGPAAALTVAGGIAFGPDGNFYVVCRSAKRVLRYHGTTGAFINVAAADPDLKSPGDIAFAPSIARETVWFDDGLPAGAVPSSTGAPWNWSALNFPISHQSAHRVPYDAPGLRQQSFDQAGARLEIQPGDRLFAYVRLDGGADGAQSAVMISWRDENNWEHRAYWGANVFTEGVNGTASRRYMGQLPRTLQWTRLEVPASLVGLEGRTVQGFTLSVFNSGTMLDRVGKISGTGADTTAPAVTISSPAENATVGGTVSIGVQSIDDGSLTHLRVRAANEIIWDAPYSGQRSFGWDSTKAANGAQTISVEARDAAGNQTTATRTVSVSNGGPPPPAGDVVWFSDALPPGGQETASTNDSWNWVTTNPAPYHGTRAHQSNGVPGIHSHTFAWANPLPIEAGDVLVTYVYLNPANPPREIMISFKDGGSWEHRAYWGENLINYGANTAPSRVRMGNLPPLGQWVRLEVPASAIWMENRPLTGMSFTLYDGQVTWDYTGKSSAATGGDRTPPAVTMTAPSNGATVSSRVFVSADLADETQLAYVQFFADDQLIETTNFGPNTSTNKFMSGWESTTVANGPHVLRVTATDTANNQTSASVQVNVANGGDTTPPAVAITAPAAGASLSGTVSIVVEATDSGSAATVEILVDDRRHWIGSVSGSTSSLWNTTSATNGPHTIKAIGTDAAGNQRTVSINVTVNNVSDSTPPVVSFTAPTNGATVSGVVEVAINATDPESGIMSAQLHVDGVFHSSDSSAPFTATWDTRTAPNGSHTLRATVHNNSGGTTIHSITVTVNNTDSGGGEVVWVDDDVPLGATRTGNEPWTWVTSNPAPTSGTRAHQSAIAWNLHEHAFDWSYNNTLGVGVGDTLFAYVYLDPANLPREIMLSFKDNNSWEHRAYWGANLIGYGTDGTASRRRIGDLPAAGGWVRLEVPASAVGLENSVLYGMAFSAFDGRVTWDAAGKITGSSPGGGGGDTTPPTVALTAPTSGATVSGSSVQLAADASDNVGVASVQFRVDGLNIGSADTTAPFSATWNSTAASNGSHTVTAVARDAAGNETTTAVVTITVSNDTSPPNVTVWMEGAIPQGAWGAGTGGDGWNWVTSNPASFSGSPAHQSNIAAGLHEHYFVGASQPLALQAGDSFFVYVYLDPANPPQAAMLSFFDGEGWEHRAYWGANLITHGADGTNSRRRIGDLPATGQWVQLQVPASAVGMEGRSIRGLSFSLFGGRATWDVAGKVSP